MRRIVTRFVAIDLAALPPIDAVRPPDASAIIAERKAAVLARVADPDLRAEIAAVMALESGLLAKINEVGAYRELVHYQRVNEAVRAVMVSTARGADLDNICARLGVQRLVITPASGSLPAAMEPDDDLRYRYQLAPEAFSVAGPYGAYEFHARSAHPHVKDAGVYGPESGLVTPGQTLTIVLSRFGDGTPSQGILDAVRAKLSDADTVPDTDEVLVRGAIITPYSIRYRLQVRPGADVMLLVTAAKDALTKYAADTHRVGRIVALSALDGAAHQDRVNVVRAVRLSPPTEVDPGPDGAPYCTKVSVEYEVVA